MAHSRYILNPIQALKIVLLTHAAYQANQSQASQKAKEESERSKRDHPFSRFNLLSIIRDKSPEERKRILAKVAAMQEQDQAYLEMARSEAEAGYVGCSDSAPHARMNKRDLFAMDPEYTSARPLPSSRSAVIHY